jgi:phosphoserine phosphatase RsbU/P
MAASTALGAQPIKKPRFKRLRTLLQVEEILIFGGVVVYAILTATNQRPSIAVVLFSFLTVGNLVIPLAFAGRKIYAGRRFPWNWVLFFPVQLIFGFICAAATIFLLQWTGIDPHRFGDMFREFGYFAMVVVLVVNVLLFGFEQYQRKLVQRNQLLEQRVEKGTIALEQHEYELKRAREIQQMLLPSTLPQVSGIQLAGAWQPAREVGGDYFDVIQLDDMRVGICVGDVAGKGITAALLMANLQASFRAFATADASPKLVCTKLNKFLCANIAAGKFVTFFYAVLDREKRTLTYENAGHCPGLLLRQNGETESLCGGGAVLGALPDWTYEDFQVELGAGDKLILSTDGITEAENAQLEEFGEGRLLEAARANVDGALEAQRHIMQCVTAFCGGNFRDDATLLVLTVT